MDAPLLVARLVLVAVFGVAGLAKLVDRTGSRQALIDFGVPASLASPLGLLLPVTELAVAIGLLPTASAWWGALGALSLLLLFLVGIGANLARGRTPNCHCFGQLRSEPVGRPTLIRNILLGAAAGFVVWQGRDNPGPSAVGWLGDLTTGERVALAVGLVLLGLVVAEALVLLQLLRQNGRLVLRLEAVETKVGIREAPPPGLPLGAPAPPFELPSLDGQHVALEDLWASGKPALLLFTSPDCGPCNQLLPEIGRWQRELVDKLTVGVISRGTTEANRSKAAEHSLARVLLQRDHEVAEAYTAYGTPSAVLVRPDGIIGSPVAQGADAIRSLVNRVGEAEPGDARRPSPTGNGRVPEHAEGVGEGPPRLGEPAPALALPDLEGHRIELADFRGSKTLVLFWSPTCGFCQQMLPDLQAWEASPPKGAPKLLVVSSGEVEANRAQGFRSPVVLDQEFAAGQAWGSGGTPSAVLVDANGRIASHVEVGAPAVLALAGAREQQAKVAVA
jgi:methylamine dehydrogenase accessory protein MauD